VAELVETMASPVGATSIVADEFGGSEESVVVKVPTRGVHALGANGERGQR
jgi:hypothetical protein